MAESDEKKPRGEHSVLGDKEEFKKDEPQDARKDEQAKDDIGHMGDRTPQKGSTGGDR